MDRTHHPTDGDARDEMAMRVAHQPEAKEAAELTASRSDLCFISCTAFHPLSSPPLFPLLVRTRLAARTRCSSMRRAARKRKATNHEEDSPNHSAHQAGAGASAGRVEHGGCAAALNAAAASSASASRGPSTRPSEEGEGETSLNISHIAISIRFDFVIAACRP